MARVVQRPGLHATIAEYLEYLLGVWHGVPDLAAEWSEWDEHSRLVFALDWGVADDRLHQLAQWAAQGLLTSAQQARYDDLLGLMARHRPLLATLLRDTTHPA